MQPSIVQVLGRKLPADDENLKLIVDFVIGRPEKGQLLFLENHYGGYAIPIERILKADTHFILVLDNHGWAWTPEMQTDATGNKFLCAIGPEVFHQLSLQEKIDYVISLFKAIDIGDWLVEFLRSNIQPTFKLLLRKDSRPAGLTKFGGLPLAPKEFLFPKDSNGRSALFIGQVHIEELKRQFQTTETLKGNGILYFFGTINVQHDGQFHNFREILVRYVDGTHSLASINLPNDIHEYGVFPEKAVEFSERISIPDEESSLLPRDLNKDETADFRYITHLLVYTYGYEEDNFGGINLLGHPESIQMCVLYEAEQIRMTEDGALPIRDNAEYISVNDTISVRARKRSHLFGFDPEAFQQLSNFPGVFNEYMDGRFYVLIEKEHLDRMNFDEAISIYQHT